MFHQVRVGEGVAGGGGGVDFRADHFLLVGMGQKHEVEQLVQGHGLAVGSLHLGLELRIGGDGAVESEAGGSGGPGAGFEIDLHEAGHFVGGDV